MTYTTGTTGGRITVKPAGLSTSVTITATTGRAITVYTDPQRTTSVSMPDVITSSKTYYVTEDDSYTISCQVQSIECAIVGGTVGAYTTYLGEDKGCTVGVDKETADLHGNAAYMGIGGAAVTQPVTLTDTAGFGNNILDIEHAANGTGGNAGQTYGINIHNAVGAVSAVVVHQYSQQGDPAIWVDNCGTAPILKLHNTQNLVTAPGQDGTGDFIQLFDHGTATLTWSKDHVLTVSNNKTFTIIGSGTTSKVMSLQTVQDITALEIVKANANGAEVVRIDNQGFGNSVRIQNNGTVNFLIDYQGLIRWVAAGNQQTTVGAAGGASALPATPTKYLKVLDSAGTTLVIPAYAAA